MGRRGHPTTPGCSGLIAICRPSFPTSGCARENVQRSWLEGEYELADTGVLDNDRFFDVQGTYAEKNALDEVCIVVRWHGPRTRADRLVWTQR